MKYVLFILSLFMTLNCIGQSLSPTRDVEATDDGIIVTYRFHGGFHQDDPLHPGAKFWKIPGFALNDVTGEPAIPIHYDWFAIPQGATVETELLECQFNDTAFVLSPSIPQIPTSEDVSELSFPPTTPFLGFFPNTIVNKGPTQSYRGHKIVEVRLSPIQYNMERCIIREYITIRYKITFKKENGEKIRGYITQKDIQHNGISASDYFFRNLMINYNSSEDSIIQQSRQISEFAQQDNRSYLILTTDSLLEAADRFAEWKRTKGMNVFIESRSHWASPDSVKHAILQHYTQDTIMYVLNIGGISEIPAKMIDFQLNDSINYNHVTDLFYAIMDNDQTIDVYVGRLPVSTLNDANTIIDKIIEYEKNPTTSALFYKRGIHSTYFEDKKRWGKKPNGGYGWISERDSIEDNAFTSTSEMIKAYVETHGKIVDRVYYTDSLVYPLRWTTSYAIYSPPDYPIRFFRGDTIPVYLQKDSTDIHRVNWNGNATDIINYINEGAFYVFHRDHGIVSKWSHPCFTTNDIALLENGNKMPVVFSMNCLTGQYNENPDCFAKKFLEKNNGGCVGIYAATRESFSQLNDLLSIAMFNTIWPTPTSNDEPLYELAQILNFGFINMNCSHNSLYYYTREIFHCFGDPSMMIYTDVPMHFSNPIVNIHNDTIFVQTTEDSVRISIYNLNTQHVDSYLGNHIEYPLGNDEIKVCLDKHNYIPYIINCGNSVFIQNETVNDTRTYKGNNISVGKSVTSTKPTGEVLINGANIKMNGKTIILDAGTTVINSNIQINGTP